MKKSVNLNRKTGRSSPRHLNRMFCLFICCCALIFLGFPCTTKIPSKHYYLVTFPMPKPFPQIKYPFTVRVKDFRISSTYNRNQLVYRYSLHELEYYNYQLWTEKPQKMVSDLVRKSIARSNLFAKVTEKLGEATPDFTLTGEIDAIEELDSDDFWYAHLAMRFQLQRFEDDKIIWTYSFDERRKVTVKEPRIVVRTLSEILDREMMKIIKNLDAFLKRKEGGTDSETTAETSPDSQTEVVAVSATPELTTPVPEEQQPGGLPYYLPHDTVWLDDSLLLSDTTPIPTGMGAIFVPASTSPEREPVVIIYKGSEKIGSSPMGRKIVLEPGEYLIQIGSGTIEQMMPHKAAVEEQRITVIEPTWASLDIRVLDEHFIPFRGTYEIIAIPSREEYGIGFGADEERAEETKVWILPPGLYKIVRAGGTYRDRTNFSTVQLTAGELTVFSLVLDEDTGNFLGAGIIEEEEGIELIRKWKFRALVGGDLLFINQTDSTRGDLEGWTTTGNVFLDSLSNYSSDKHRLNLRLEVEEGLVKRPDENAQTLNDRLYFHSIYTYFWRKKFGPYVRAGIETALTNRYFYFENDQIHTIYIFDSDHKKASFSHEEERVKLAQPFAPIQLKEGFGGNLNLYSTEFLDLSVRLGLGARQYIAHDYLTNIEETETEATFQEVDDYYIEGFELSFVAFARTTRYIAWSCEFDSLFPFNKPDDYILNLRNIVSLRLVSFASLNYKIDLFRDSNVNAEHPTSVQHQFLLRFSYTLL
ncbi:ABC-type transport auxiliary lipoprotein family protein [candidate division CSSED10-310 bacterium]|uniref:ABC-type transport auxiliary lipoprotein family protein n=1 Tax=candidate division CSSED10-310 bacterium TaxID=2855610 RepID=A0ABV6YTU9_UNCC1